VLSFTPRPLYLRKGDPLPIVQEGRWSPGPVWTDADSFHRDSVPGPSRPQQAAIPTELSRPTELLRKLLN
jgi:hypothetical protein